MLIREPGDELHRGHVIGVLLDSRFVPGWVAYAIDGLSKSSQAKVVLVVASGQRQEQARAGQGPILLRLWNSMDRVLRANKTDSLRCEEIDTLLNRLSVGVIRISSSTCLAASDSDLELIKQAGLDWLVYTGNDMLGPAMTACARSGMLSLKEADCIGASKLSGLFCDMCEGNPVSRHAPRLIMSTSTHSWPVYAPTVAISFLSLALNQNAVYWDMAEALVRLLYTPAELKAHAYSPSQSMEPGNAGANRLSNLRVLGYFAQWSVRLFRHEMTKRLLREQWSIGVQVKGTPSAPTNRKDLLLIHPPDGRFYADPFLLESNGRHFLFFEDYSFPSRKGVIACCELYQDGRYSEPAVVLERDYHLSYPFVFKLGSEVYMIPETREQGTIELHRATGFPHAWTLEAVLVSDIWATDTTLLYYRNKWWLFTAGVLRHTDPNQSLWLFHSETLLGPWLAHPKNPIVSDLCCARPAGCFRVENGSLIRPGQDCLTTYGRAIHLRRVDVLSEDDYRESPFETIDPSLIRGCRGIHTINQTSQFTVLDCRFLIPRFKLPFLRSVWRRRESFAGTVSLPWESGTGATP